MARKETLSAEDRFWSKVDKDGPVRVPLASPFCWSWLASLDAYGYGQFAYCRPRKTMVKAHRFAYELVVGAIPAGLTIDHLCRNRACVNPAHMEPVTNEENFRRGDASRRSLVCPQGHEYTPANTWTGKNGKRCRTCNREFQRARRAAGRSVAA